MKEFVTGTVSVLMVVLMGVVMFFSTPESTDYSESFTEVTNRIDDLDRSMASQSSAINQLSRDMELFRSSASDFDSGGSDESAKDESSWDDSPVNPKPTIDDGWSPSPANVSNGGSSGGYSSQIVSSSFCPCGPNCNCANVSFSSRPVVTRTVSSGGSTGGYSSSYSTYSTPATTNLFNRVRAVGSNRVLSRPVIQRPILRGSGSVTCSNGQCYLN